MAEPHSSMSGIVTELAPQFRALADDIWSFAELGFEEVRSVAAQIALLQAREFRVTETLADLSTAFMAEAGSGGPVIAFLGEFDALAGLSQEAGAVEQRPIRTGGSGHGCGHNLLGAGSMLAATALVRHLADTGAQARVRYYGCPAEEGGFAKGMMVAKGAFDDVDIAIGWHPSTFNGVRARATQAVLNRTYRFRGTAAHAGMSPHLGRSALDALELMNIGANFLREHMAPGCGVQYAITDAGGAAPNVVPANAAARYMIRAPRMGAARDLAARVDDIARGAALMTGTTVEITPEGGASNVLPNMTLCRAMHEAMAACGPLLFDAEELAFGAKLVETMPVLPKATGQPEDQFPGDAVGHIPFHTGLRAFHGTWEQRFGSTDVGDVSWVVPVVECSTSTWAAGTPSHSWQAVSQGKSASAHRAMQRAALVMAMTGYRAATDAALRTAAWAELEDRRGEEDYISPFSIP